MTISVYYLTKTFNRAVVKIVGTADGDSVTVPISDNLCVSGQYASSPSVNISHVAYSTSSAGYVEINRSGAVFKLFGHDTLSYGEVQNVKSDITVSFMGSPGGTVILELSKTDGFSAVNPIEVDPTWYNIQSLYNFPGFIDPNYTV